MPHAPDNRESPLSSTRALRDFLVTETASGAMLVFAAVVAVVWANSPWQASYETLWHTRLGVHLGDLDLELDLRHWVNEGLMALFFLVVGLEVKRELVLGELRDRRQAALPVIAAAGGMLLPAALYAALNVSGSGSHGWGIPMATDIAFAIGVLALVAPNIPSGARLFLLTLAIADDIGSIIVIAVFYTSGIDVPWLFASIAVVGAVIVLRQFGFRTTPLFAALGLALWIAVHASGVHATLAGVVMGLLVPATPVLNREIVRSRTDELLDVFTPEAARETRKIARQAVSQLEWLEHELHGWTSLAVVPVFALANAGVVFTSDGLRDAVSSPITAGVVLGLVVGKTLGITGAAWLAVRRGFAELPHGVNWRHITGTAALGGIGFTVSLFMTGLAFDSDTALDEAKIGIFVASAAAAIAGALILRRSVSES